MLLTSRSLKNSMKSCITTTLKNLMNILVELILKRQIFEAEGAKIFYILDAPFLRLLVAQHSIRCYKKAVDFFGEY